VNICINWPCFLLMLSLRGFVSVIDDVFSPFPLVGGYSVVSVTDDVSPPFPPFSPVFPRGYCWWLQRHNKAVVVWSFIPHVSPRTSPSAGVAAGMSGGNCSRWSVWAPRTCSRLRESRCLLWWRVRVAARFRCVAWCVLRRRDGVCCMQ